MTAQESYRAWKQAKDREYNAKKYSTEAVRKYNNMTVAECESWRYVLTVYSDNSAGLDYIAKDSHHGSGAYCSTAILKHHLKTTRTGWTITEPGFFEALGIRPEDIAV